MKNEMNNALMERERIETQLKNEKSQKESLFSKVTELEELLKNNKIESE